MIKTTQVKINKSFKNFIKSRHSKVITFNKNTKLNSHNKLAKVQVGKKSTSKFSLADRNSWEKVLLSSCHVNPLYLSSNYP